MAMQNMREHRCAVLLVGGPNRVDDVPSAEVDLEEDGRCVDGHWHEFRFLNAPTNADLQRDPELVRQISISYDEGRMFTIDLQVVQGREAILKRARA